LLALSPFERREEALLGELAARLHEAERAQNLEAQEASGIEVLEDKVHSSNHDNKVHFSNHDNKVHFSNHDNKVHFSNHDNNVHFSNHVGMQMIRIRA